MKFWLFVLFTALSVKCFSQEKAIAGIVFDKDSKIRLARIFVQNTTSGETGYNNLNGVFTINAEVGDKLIFSKADYINDTIKVENHMPIAIYMKKVAIQLHEVTIRDTALTPEKKLAATKKEYSRAYGTLANADLLNTSSQGTGLGIDALWSLFSREGKDIRQLQAMVERDYRQDVIDYRYNKTLVTRITGLKDKKLVEFMQKYRPGYYFVLNATDYEFVESVKNNYKRYLRNPNARILPSLAMPAKQ